MRKRISTDLGIIILKYFNYNHRKKGYHIINLLHNADQGIWAYIKLNYSCLIMSYIYVNPLDIFVLAVNLTTLTLNYVTFSDKYHCQEEECFTCGYLVVVTYSCECFVKVDHASTEVFFKQLHSFRMLWQIYTRYTSFTFLKVNARKNK